MIVAVSVVVLVLAMSGYYIYTLGKFKNAGNRSVSVDSNTVADTITKSGSADTTVNDNVDTTKNTAEVPVSNETTLVITNLYQEGNNVIYQAKVTNPGASGTCSAVFTNSVSKPVTYTSNISGGDCGPFTLSINNFDSVGSWLLTLRYYSGNEQVVATKNIELK